MALLKEKNLRKIEIMFVDGDVLPTAHCEYQIKIKEQSGESMDEIASNTHRENISIEEAKSMINASKNYIFPDQK